MSGEPSVATGKQPSQAAGETAQAGQVVARNAFYLAVGQVVSAAISFGVTALLARHLGAEGYGILYLSTAFVQSVFIVVEFGQNYVVVSAVAREPRRAGELLGTGVAFRLLATLVIYLPVIGISYVLGYTETTRTAIALMLVFHLVISVGGGFSVIFRGLERMDCEAVTQVALKVLVAAGSLLAVALSADVIGVIRWQVAGAILALVVFVLVLKRLRLPKPRVALSAARRIVKRGVPFLYWNVVITVHMAIDAILLSKLAPEEVVGWYGAVAKLVGLLIFPPIVLAAALYPTLSRLFVSDPDRYRDLARSGLKLALLLGALTAVGTYLFARDAVFIVFGEEGFGPAVDILRVYCPYIFLVFIPVTVGSAVLAAERQTPYAVTKTGCVLLLTVLNLVLIPLCQSRFGNGGIGTAAATSATEVVMVTATFVLLPKGTLKSSLWRDAARALLAAAATILVVWLLGDIPLWLGAPVAVLTYVAVVALLGGVRRGDLALLREALRREGNHPTRARP